MSFKKTEAGLISKYEKFDVVIKYSEDAKEKELIKFVVEDKEVVISADEILNIIREQFNQKEMALALSTTDINFIPAIETAIPISYIANKDIKQGERVQFFAPFTIPLGMARVMEANRLCIIKGKEVKLIPKEEYEETAKTLEDASKEFVEKYWKPQIDELKKLRTADNG